MGELSEQNQALIERVNPSGMPRAFTSASQETLLNRLLDAARTEGRGEGEPVACVLVPREPTDMMLKAYYEAKHPSTDTPAGGLTRWATWEEASELPGWVDEQRACYRAMIAAASPIREPEISREPVVKLLADHFGFRPYEQMAEDKSDLRGKIRDGYDVNEPTKSDLAEVADAILNLAPVAKGAGAEPGAGWVYNSPDTGMEYSTVHPLESGEIPDATDVRRSTFFEDWMFGEIGRLDAKVRELVVNLAPVGGRWEGWRPIETAPVETHVIVCADTYGQQRLVLEAFQYIDAGWQTFGLNGPRKIKPTHWQPLPPPPQEQANEESQTNGS